MEHFLEHWGYTAIFFVALIEAVAIPFPSEITFGFTAALAAEGKYGFNVTAVIALAVAGEICGCVVAYAIGKVGGRALIDRYGKYILLLHKDLNRADDFMAKRGVLSVFFGRLIPVIRAVISLVAGVGEMPFGRFLASTAASTIVYGVGVGGLGYALGANFHKYTKVFTYVGVAVAIAVVALIVVSVLHRLAAICESNVSPPADLTRSTQWAGLRPGDPVQVEGTQLRGATWKFVAHVSNVETGEEWVEVVGGKAGDRAVRSFHPGQLYAKSARPGRDPSLADAPGLPL